MTSAGWELSKMIAKKAPNPTDRHVGSRVRMRRMMLGLSQTKLGDALGLTFQQVQKYERGTNRISASRLQHISEVLQVPVPLLRGLTARTRADSTMHRPAPPLGMVMSWTCSKIGKIALAK